MRYDTEVSFYINGDEEYNPDTGRTEASKKLIDTKLASVTTPSRERVRASFGDVEETVKIIRLLRFFDKEWEYAEIDGKTYALMDSKEYRKRTSFYVREVVVDG